jgi:hypothetical protein
VTFDKGKQWMRVKANLPTVPIYEITLHPRDNAMILATHGRSIWILDDMTALQQFAKARSTDAHLFDIRAATQMNPARDRSRDFEGDMQFLGKIPDIGAAFTYYLKLPAKKLTLTVKDASGSVVRELAGDDVKEKTQPVSIRSSGICALNLCRVRERLKVAAGVGEAALVAAVLMGRSFYPARIK